MFVFPFTSVTVKVTVFAPIFSQSNVVWFNINEAIPQLSVEPLSIWVAVTEAWPFASKNAVTFCVITVGNTVSPKVTVKDVESEVL